MSSRRVFTWQCWGPCWYLDLPLGCAPIGFCSSSCRMWVEMRLVKPNVFALDQKRNRSGTHAGILLRLWLTVPASSYNRLMFVGFILDCMYQLGRLVSQEDFISGRQCRCTLPVWAHALLWPGNPGAGVHRMGCVANFVAEDSLTHPCRLSG